jgi:peptide/nickel transport system substrate-binding protein
MESVTMRGPTFHRLSLLGMALLAALVAGHAAAASLTVALQTDASSMDPHVAPTFTTAALQDHIYGRT